METNCYWATQERETREKLRYLKEKGLKGILVSVNPFFLEYVPFERTDRTIRISEELFGNNLMIYQIGYYWQFRALGIKGKISFKDYLKIEKPQDLSRDAEFFIMGRAPYKLDELLKGSYPRYPAGHFFKQPCRPAFLRNWHNHFDNYGNFMPGYCGGISLGDWRELDILIEKGIDDGEYPILAFLIDNDMEGLFNFARGHGYLQSSEGYFSKCHLCCDIRKHLIEKDEFKELRPKQFYFHLN